MFCVCFFLALLLPSFFNLYKHVTQKEHSQSQPPSAYGVEENEGLIIKAPFI